MTNYISRPHIIHVDVLDESHISVTCYSGLTGTSTRELPLSLDMFEHWIDSGELIQDVLGFLSPGDREFLLTGMTETAWDEMFGMFETDEE